MSARWIEIVAVEDGKVCLLVDGAYEYWAESGDGIKVGVPDLNVYRIIKDDDGSKHQGAIHLPENVRKRRKS